MLRDIERRTDKVQATAQVISEHAPDVLILQGFDFDDAGFAANAFAGLLAEDGLTLPHLYAPRPNTGRPTGLDIDGDGRSYGARDAHGYGRFFGQSAIQVLSKYPIQVDKIQDFGTLLWRDVTPKDRLATLIPTAAIDQLRLASVAAAAVPISVNGQTLWILTHHASPPVFDGPEDRNGYRNAAENLFWLTYLADQHSSPNTDPHILAGQINIDLYRGEGQKYAVEALLKSDAFQDPFADWPLADRHTVVYPAPGPGPLRVSYILPSRGLRPIDRGLADSDLHRHRLIWVDVRLEN